MLCLIYGGSGSGKSTFAEQLAEDLTTPGPKLYIATMRPWGEDATKRIHRHRQAREGKGFSTVERYTDLGGLSIPRGSVVLLECLGNLLANELFGEDGAGNHAVSVITFGLEHLERQGTHVIVVSNDVGGDGMTYSEETMNYQRMLAQLNASLAARSHLVTEMVCGVPLIYKGTLP